MNKLLVFISALFLGALFLMGFSSKAHAVTVAEQTPGYSNSLNVWQVLQELGDNLSGVAASFTFRVSTSKTNLEQFDFTAGNSQIYDKEANLSIAGCAPSGYNPADPLWGLTFTTSGVPTGYQDVTIDLSCRDYTFIPGHRYLIMITNANMAAFGGKRIYFGSAAYSGTSSDYFSGGGLRYGFDNGSCSATSYVWGSSSANSGCNIWTSTKDDLYFKLSNTSPPPKTPVIFIPGIGGSEIKATQDLIWSALDGHGGTFSHAYAAGEKIWVNQDEAAKLGDDDYFDVLRLKTDGETPEADLSLTGSLTSFGYGDIDSFFASLGYTKGTNFFVFTYDWRKDVSGLKSSLDSLVDEAKNKSGQIKVNMVAHSLGGILARYYIQDSGKASKVNKLIGLGVPHLGAVDGLKSLIYGVALKSKVFGILQLGIPASEIKDLSQNLTSVFQLLPSNKYFDFYDNSNNDLIYPFYDDRDMDKNNITGSLNFSHIKTLLTNLGHNMTTFSKAENFHQSFSSSFSQTNGINLYQIVGTAQPTLGQIKETYLFSWPVNLIERTEEIFINGDGTVPLFSASLKNNSLNLSGGATLYFVEQTHNDLVNKNGTAMKTVRAILEQESLPVEVKSEKVNLEGDQISLDDGELDLYDDSGNHTGLKSSDEVEINIADTHFSGIGKQKTAFVKKSKKVKAKLTKKSSSTTKKSHLKVKKYRQDKVSKMAFYQDIPLDKNSKIEFDLDTDSESFPALTFYPDSAANNSTSISTSTTIQGSALSDQTPPQTKIDLSGDKITLTAKDNSSGVLKTEYTLDNGVTVKTYTEPFTVSSPGKYTLQVKSIDSLGNEETPKTSNFEIKSSSAGSSSSSSTNLDTSVPASILGEVVKKIKIKETGQVLAAGKRLNEQDLPIQGRDERLSGLLKVAGSILAVLTLLLLGTFIYKPPK